MKNAVLLAVLAGLCWGIGEVLAKQVLATGRVHHWTVLLVRCAFALPLAAIAYFIAARFARHESTPLAQLPASIWVKMLIGPALFAAFGGVAFFYLALRHGDISTVKPIAFALAPAFAAVIGWIFLNEEVTFRKAAGIALMLVGLVLVAGANHTKTA